MIGPNADIPHPRTQDEQRRIDIYKLATILLESRDTIREKVSTIDTRHSPAKLEVMIKDKLTSQLDPEAKKIFTATEVSVILEDIDSKLGFLVDGQKTLDQRIGRIEGSMDTFEGRMDRLDVRMGRLETQVSVLTDTVGEMKVELTEIDEKLDQKADVSEVRQLEQRVTALEATHP